MSPDRVSSKVATKRWPRPAAERLANANAVLRRLLGLIEAPHDGADSSSEQTPGANGLGQRVG